MEASSEPLPELTESQSDPPPARLSVVVPCFNEENGIVDAILGIRQTLAGVGPYELIVVNDGSTDDTPSRLDTAAAEYDSDADEPLRIIHHPNNQGYGAALKTGLRQARGELILITDADGTYPLHEAPKLIRELEQCRADMVVGSRTAPGSSYSSLRRLPKIFLSRYVSWVARRPVPDMNSGLRVFRKEAAEEFINILPSGFSFTTTITLAMMTRHYRVHFVPIQYVDRVGQSKIKPVRDTLSFVQLIARTGMYFAPLRVLLPVAMVLFLAGCVSLSYDLYWWNITETTVTLFLFTMNTIIFAMLADMIDKRSDR